MLIFNKMALIFPGVLVVFTISSFEFQRFRHCLDFIANHEWSQFIQPQSTGLSSLEQCWSLITSCNRSQKQLSSFKMKFS